MPLNGAFWMAETIFRGDGSGGRIIATNAGLRRDMYYRMRSSNIWSDWIRLWDNNNLLIEQGTFIVTLNNSANSQATGTYFKINKWVWINFELSGMPKGNDGDVITVAGIPFPPNKNSAYMFPVTLATVNEAHQMISYNPVTGGLSTASKTGGVRYEDVLFSAIFLRAQGSYMID